MRITYGENPHPTVMLIDTQLGITLKSIGVSSYDVAQTIADSMANGHIKASEMMGSDLATGSDVLKRIAFNQLTRR